MSNKESVFLPSNGSAQFNDLLSATSAPTWSKVANENGASDGQGHAKNLMNEINGLLSEVRKSNTVTGLDQAGGKRKRKSSSGKKAKKASSGKKAKKASSGKARKVSRPKKASSGKKAKKASSSKKVKKASSSKKGKRMSGGDAGKKKREMPQAIKDIRKLAEVIVKEIPELKDGIPMTSTASQLIKKNGGLEDAISAVKKDKSAVKKLYNQVVKDQKEKREAKKANKANSKSDSE